MAPGTAATISSLKVYLSEYPSIKLITPDSADFEDSSFCWVSYPDKTPFAVVRPQSALEVQALIRFVTANNVDFTIRAGGHDCAGRSQAKDSLMIDLRDINSVHIDESKTSARVGGGTLVRQLTKTLGEQGLVTPRYSSQCCQPHNLEQSLINILAVL